ncbi:hypothetical protein QBC33DRAFT_552274 [Phialemonium atrogriseum]|uniref:Uncharacterized protein n=1 Tax=Phialemonium atrogriseum TaxID=1093897 RepID=A0AAJ0BQC4_9PEZI|nr:uncharacterized protein QBC33DRAFT_552274 [Phialemonium atrogriseum]KAK1762316.1 hypothetical protein QBC33DRAFT_552274 [Phialemonium atrogriseum]
MPQNSDIEMQYRAAESMHAHQTPNVTAAPQQQQQQQQGASEQQNLNLRGGGMLLDLCACFICCECMEGCCHGIEDCLCCCC